MQTWPYINFAFDQLATGKIRTRQTVTITAMCLASLYSHNATAAPGKLEWTPENRRISLTLGKTHQNYREADSNGVTADGELDRETGTLNTWNLQLSWQGDPWSSEHIQVFAATGLQRSNGSTRYRGYMQQGGQLSPYAATSGNVDWQYSLQLGVALPQNQVLQWVPYLGLQYRCWERQLTQYPENFTHTGVQAGLLAQWRVNAKWSAEFNAAWGGIIKANLTARTLGFNQALGKAPTWDLVQKFSYRIDPQLSLDVAAHHRQWKYGQSNLQLGMREPESRTRQTGLGAGLSWNY